MTRGSALLSVSALFLSGVSIGALGMHLYASYNQPEPRRHERPGPGGPAPIMEVLADRLELTGEQREEIHGIHERARADGRAMREELRPRMQARIEQTREQILAVLTDEQREKFNALHDQYGGSMDRFMIGGGHGGRRGRGGRRRP